MRKIYVTRKIYIGVAMLAIAVTSFAIGRSTSGSLVISPTKAETYISIHDLQSLSRDLPELRVDTPY